MLHLINQIKLCGEALREDNLMHYKTRKELFQKDILKCTSMLATIIKSLKH